MIDKKCLEMFKDTHLCIKLSGPNCDELIIIRNNTSSPEEATIWALDRSVSNNDNGISFLCYYFLPTCLPNLMVVTVLGLALQTLSSGDYFCVGAERLRKGRTWIFA
jgi:hypothetical protein